MVYKKPGIREAFPSPHSLLLSHCAKAKGLCGFYFFRNFSYSFRRITLAFRNFGDTFHNFPSPHSLLLSHCAKAKGLCGFYFLRNFSYSFRRITLAFRNFGDTIRNFSVTF